MSLKDKIIKTNDETDSDYLYKEDVKKAVLEFKKEQCDCYILIVKCGICESINRIFGEWKEK